ncbi:hypothetical protein ABT301_00830 [Streptomyces sp. NPDC000987]|uniref:hypothetical protein n=1 Tax=Streptomyces sp. NPDC000987 TaxID=3154374 RepID=UPI00332148DA
MLAVVLVSALIGFVVGRWWQRTSDLPALRIGRNELRAQAVRQEIIEQRENAEQRMRDVTQRRWP